MKKRAWCATHTAIFKDGGVFDEYVGDPVELPVMEDRFAAYSEEEWNKERRPMIEWDMNYQCWCWNGGWRVVILAPVDHEP